MDKVFNGEYEKVFDGKKLAKLGTEKRPAVITVPTKKRMNELIPIFEKNGWHYKFNIERDKPEDLTELNMLKKRPKTITVKEKPGRNDPCPCGSGKKHKNCCGA